LALPRSSSVRLSSLMPRSSVIARPPVRTAMSSRVALRRSPKPGRQGPRTGIGTLDRRGGQAPQGGRQARHPLPNLEHRYADIVVLTFGQIEDLLGFALPDAARTRREWWTLSDPDGDRSSFSEAWVWAGRTASPNLLADGLVRAGHAVAVPGRRARVAGTVSPVPIGRGDPGEERPAARLRP
jgi:hypothetical protein